MYFFTHALSSFHNTQLYHRDLTIGTPSCLEHHSLIWTNYNMFKMLSLARSWRLQSANTSLLS